MPTNNQKNIVNYPLGHLQISGGDICAILDFVQQAIEKKKKAFCIPLNLIKYGMSKKDSKLQNVILKADLVIADGIPIAWFAQSLGLSVCRITGIDLAESIFENAVKHQWKFFFLGASSANLKTAMEKLLQKYPNLSIVGAHHGYFSPQEVEKIIQQINSSQADILFVGLGLPQKEYFIQDHLEKIAIKFCLPIGGAFDIWAQTKKRTPKFLQKIGLEWLYRSLYDKSRAIYVMKYGKSLCCDFLISKINGKN